MSEETTTEPEAKPAAKKRAPRKAATKPPATKGATPPLAILDEVAAMHAEQGEQSRPLIGGFTLTKVMAEEYGRQANSFREINKHRTRLGVEGWDSIAAGAVFEAFSQRDPAAARVDLVRLAALAVAAIESIDRQ